MVALKMFGAQLIAAGRHAQIDRWIDRCLGREGPSIAESCSA